MLNQIYYEMGRKMAEQIVGQDNLAKLDAELDRLGSLDEKNFQKIDWDNFPLMQKILKIVGLDLLSQHLEKKVLPSTKSKIKKEIFSLVKDGCLGKEGSTALIHALVFERPLEKSHKCIICGSRQKVGKIPVFNRFDEVTNLVEDGLSAYACFKCTFYLWLSNVYPLPHLSRIRELGNKRGFEVLGRDAVPIYVFFEDDALFERLIKHLYIREHLFGQAPELFFVFYLQGDQASNNELLFFSSLQAVDLLQKMIEWKYTDSKHFSFSKALFDSQFSKDECFGTKYFIEVLRFLERGEVSVLMLKLVLAMTHMKVKDNYKNNYFWAFNSFCSFYSVYLKVKGERMDAEKLCEWALDKGATFGWRIVESAKKSDEDIDGVIKRIRALSGTMELSAQTFLDGIAKMERAYDVSFPARKEDQTKITKMAENEKARLSFIIGLLKSVLSRVDAQTERPEGGA